MFIYIDESGSFVPSPTVDSWNVVAAYVAPEATRRRVELALKKLKLSTGRTHAEEIKLKDLTEAQVKAFISQLGSLDATLFATCIDLGAERPAAISAHQAGQVDRIRSNKPRMIYEEGREMIEDLASRVERLSPQLYTQFVAQLDLLDQVYRATTLYYSQRVPATLSSFRWRIDEKNSTRPLFEETMRYMAPPVLQSRSLSEPAIFVEGFDYTHYERQFRYDPDEIPAYLQEAAGHTIKSASNLAKVLRDFEFVRSHDVPGVQVSDLLASAFRRSLRREFDDSLGIARLLGSLMVQRARPDTPVRLITLGEEQYASGHAYDLAHAAKKSARPMLK